MPYMGGNRGVSPRDACRPLGGGLITQHKATPISDLPLALGVQWFEEDNDECQSATNGSNDAARLGSGDAQVGSRGGARRDSYCEVS